MSLYQGYRGIWRDERMEDDNNNIFWTLTLVSRSWIITVPSYQRDAYDDWRMCWMDGGCTPEANYVPPPPPALPCKIISGSIYIVSADATLFICNMLNSMHWIIRSIPPSNRNNQFGHLWFSGSLSFSTTSTTLLLFKIQTQPHSRCQGLYHCPSRALNSKAFPPSTSFTRLVRCLSHLLFSHCLGIAPFSFLFYI